MSEEITNGKFDYLGVSMPVEFAEVCKEIKFKSKIESRKDIEPGYRIFRFYSIFEIFLKTKYQGSLPKDLVSLAREFCYDESKVDLFVLPVDEYKEKYPEIYKDFFENLPKNEQMKKFISADYGARTVFELQQDVIASNLFEDMLVFHGLGYLKPNSEATGRYIKVSNTNCDLICTLGDSEDEINIPLEIKTRWNRRLKEKEMLYVRGSSHTIISSKGMILALYMNMENIYGALVDTVTCNNILKGEMSVVNKECDEFQVSADNLFEFKFWDEKAMKDMIDRIEELYWSRYDDSDSE